MREQLRKAETALKELCTQAQEALDRKFSSEEEAGPKPDEIE